MKSARRIAICSLVGLSILAGSPALAAGGAADLAVKSYLRPTVGRGVVSGTGAGETLHMPAPSRWGGSWFTIVCRNSGDSPAQLLIKGQRRSHKHAFVYELRGSGGTLITRDVVGGGYLTRRLPAGAAVRILVHIMIAPAGSAVGYVSGRSALGGPDDAVKIVIGRS